MCRRNGDSSAPSGREIHRVMPEITIRTRATPSSHAGALRSSVRDRSPCGHSGSMLATRPTKRTEPSYDNLAGTPSTTCGQCGLRGSLGVYLPSSLRSSTAASDGERLDCSSAVPRLIWIVWLPSRSAVTSVHDQDDGGPSGSAPNANSNLSSDDGAGV